MTFGQKSRFSEKNPGNLGKGPGGVLECLEMVSHAIRPTKIPQKLHTKNKIKNQKFPLFPFCGVSIFFTPTVLPPSPFLQLVFVFDSIHFDSTITIILFDSILILYYHPF